MKNIQDARSWIAPGARRLLKLTSATRRSLVWYGALLAGSFASPAGASLFQGDTLDQVADIVAWVALIVGPTVLVVVFWLVHIMPEKIAEKRKHPQAKAIQTLCVLSLFFGGLLWPIAWLWAYTKPVFHKMAYGTDVEEHDAGAHAAADPAPVDDAGVHRSRVIKVVDREHELPIENATNRERA